ncbi:MAG TPA: hypothetical protein VKQ29_04730 [Aliidongia sp.]|nr:hypothetical protein [Aliidongia sp.]
MISTTADGSFVSDNGKVLFFSCKRFVTDICEGDCCFICGAKPSDKPFNKEHVLPEWLLRRYDLFDKRINLPNGSRFSYGQYTIPCCVECNSLMAREIETPISELIRRGSGAVYQYIEKHGTLKFYVWLGLIFLKTHLKDRDLRYHRDLRKEDGPISSLYTWENLHHLHALVRCFYTGSFLSPGAIGSFLLIAARTDGSSDEFDFADLYHAQTLLLRIGDIAFVAVFDDSNGAASCLQPMMEILRPPLTQLQLREVMTEFSLANLRIKDRPKFYTTANPLTGFCAINVDRPDAVELEDLDYEMRGELMHFAIRDMLPNISYPNSTREEFEAEILTGRRTFL